MAGCFRRVGGMKYVVTIVMGVLKVKKVTSCVCVFCIDLLNFSLSASKLRN